MKLISFIFLELFLGIVLGLAGGFLLIGVKNKIQTKNVIKEIEKQDLKKGKNKTPINFYKKREKLPKTEKIVAQNGSLKTKKEKKPVKVDRKLKKPKKRKTKKK